MSETTTWKYPRQKKFEETLFLKTFLPDTLKSKLHVLTIQNVVKCIRKSGNHEDWIGEFE